MAVTNALTNEELSVQGTGMVTWLHQELANALGQIASLRGEIALLNMRLAEASKPKPEPETTE